MSLDKDKEARALIMRAAGMLEDRRLSHLLLAVTQFIDASISSDAAQNCFNRPVEVMNSEESYVPQDTGTKNLYIISNVNYPLERRIKEGTNDILVFLNKAYSAHYYKDDPVKKFCYRRSSGESYGVDVPYCDNKLVFDGDNGIPKEFIEKLRKEYDWDYPIEDGKVRSMTTGYMVAMYMREKYPDYKVILVNFGYDVKRSTYRCPWHNWRFEAEQLKGFEHIYTADKVETTAEKRRIFYKLSSYLGDNVYATAVVKSVANNPSFAINVKTNRTEFWEKCPYLDSSITEDNADLVIKQGNVYPWNIDTPHIITGTLAKVVQDVGVDIEQVTDRPEIYCELPKERLIEKPYVIISAGWQNSAKTKKWSRKNWLGLIDMCPEITFVQVGQSKNNARPLPGVINMIDKTSDIDLFRLVRDARCVISPPSGIIHAAGAFNTPFVCISGGREPSSLVSYSCGVMLSSCGKLECCLKKGCHLNGWDGDKACKDIVKDGDECTGRCMDMITPQEVKDAIMSLLNKDNKKNDEVRG